jgi:ABC-type glycerol-3-phosphate transport system permease component
VALGRRPGPAALPLGIALRRYSPAAIDRQLRYTLYSLLAIVVTLIFLFPLFWGLSTSLRPPLETFTVNGFGIPWIDFTPTLDNWIEQLEVPETQRALYNSTFIATFATLLALLIGTPAAYGLARFRFVVVPNRDLTIFFLAQRILPPVATVIPFYLMMALLGLLDTQLGLILINATFILPFVVVILRQGFLDLPVELEESALVDGADHFRAFLRISLPHLVLFSTGRGSVVGSAVAPVIKVCANPETYRRLEDDMDVDAGRILEGRATLAQVGDELFALIKDVAAGAPTKSEALGHQEFILGYKTFEPLGPSCLPV